jgi:hypothetical protein
VVLSSGGDDRQEALHRRLIRVLPQGKAPMGRWGLRPGHEDLGPALGVKVADAQIDRFLLPESSSDVSIGLQRSRLYRRPARASRRIRSYAAWDGMRSARARGWFGRPSGPGRDGARWGGGGGSHLGQRLPDVPACRAKTQQHRSSSGAHHVTDRKSSRSINMHPQSQRWSTLLPRSLFAASLATASVRR